MSILLKSCLYFTYTKREHFQHPIEKECQCQIDILLLQGVWWAAQKISIAWTENWSFSPEFHSTGNRRQKILLRRSQTCSTSPNMAAISSRLFLDREQRKLGSGQLLQVNKYITHTWPKHIACNPRSSDILPTRPPSPMYSSYPRPVARVAPGGFLLSSFRI